MKIMTMRLLKVLFVDDELDLLELATLYINKYDSDLVVETSTSGKEAMQKLEKTYYDCIVLDQDLPDITGLELAEKVKSKTSSPIILYTGKGSEEIASQSSDYGVDNYLRKEPDPEHFKILARRIRFSAERHSLEVFGRAEQEHLTMFISEYPKVAVRGKTIYILDENGGEEVWSIEKTEALAIASTKEVEMVLKALKYGKNYLSKALTELMYDLIEMGIPAEYRNDIIERGYGDVKELLGKITQKNGS